MSDAAKTIPYEVRKSEKARRMRLRVHMDGRVEVVIPKRARVTGIDAFVLQNADWIRAQQHRFQEQRRKSEQAAYEVSGTVLFRGRPVKITFLPSADGRLGVRWDGEGERFLVRSTVDTKPGDVRDLLEMWFRKAARQTFEERVRALNAETQYPWTTIRIAEQKTRWGSCSRRGTLSFNWRLLMAPPEVLDYVVLHELAHLKEMNHSPRFWSLVESACPDYKRHIQWLKDHGPSLVI